MATRSDAMWVFRGPTRFAKSAKCMRMQVGETVISIETVKLASSQHMLGAKAHSSFKIDRFDHPSEDSGRMRTLRNHAAIQK